MALYFDHLGFPGARIGELVAIPMLMRCVAPNLWGLLGDYTGRRLAIVRFGAVCTLTCFSLILVDKSYAWLAMVMALQAFFWQAVLPQFEVITLAHLQGQTARYSRLRLWGSIGFILTVVGIGRLFEWFSLDLYPQTVLVIMSCVLISTLWVPNAQPPLSTQRAPGEGFLKQLFSPGVPVFFACVALMQLSHGPYYTFLTLHLEHLGYSRGTIGMLWAVGVIAEVLMFLAMGRILLRFSVRHVLIVSFVLAALRWILLGNLADHLPVLLFTQLLHAATFGAFHAAAIQFLQLSFGARQQGQAQALYAALSGTGGALGALYSGYSWSALGAGWTFNLASLAAVSAAGLAVLRMHKQQRA